MAIPVPEKRIQDFEEMGFGLFIHWGLYSQLGQGEWTQFRLGIPTEEYSKLADTFTAAKFDGRKLAQIAKAAGCKYINLTTRHHEGFSLYDTRGLNTYDAPHSAAGRDLIREFVDGCNAEGIVPFFYHTTMDWYNPDYYNDFPKYLQYLRDSVEVLCSEYGQIGGLWFDGNWNKPDDDWEEDALYDVIRKHQPEAIIVNNTGLFARGCLGNPQLDSVTFEQGHPTPMAREGMPKYLAAEMCQTMNSHWAYANNDYNYKSLATLIKTLCACRKVGANYLLNVGLDPEGEILPMQADLLMGIGRWIKTCGQSIYKAKPCGVQGVDEDFGLRNGNKIYFYVHELSINGVSSVTVKGGGVGNRDFTGVPGRISNLHWVDNDEVLEFTQDGSTVTMNCTGYPYGMNLVVRVAEADIED